MTASIGAILYHGFGYENSWFNNAQYKQNRYAEEFITCLTAPLWFLPSLLKDVVYYKSIDDDPALQVTNGERPYQLSEIDLQNFRKHALNQPNSATAKFLGRCMDPESAGKVLN